MAGRPIGRDRPDRSGAGRMPGAAVVPVAHPRMGAAEPLAPGLLALLSAARRQPDGAGRWLAARVDQKAAKRGAVAAGMNGSLPRISSRTRSTS